MAQPATSMGVSEGVKMKKALQVAVLLVITLALCIGGFFLALALIRISNIPEELGQYEKTFAVFIAVFGGLAVPIVKSIVTNRESPEREPPRIPEPKKPRETDKHLIKIQKLTTLANHLFHRKELWKGYARDVESSNGYNRTRLIVWRTAFVFAISCFASSLLSSGAIYLKYPEGTDGVAVEWYYNYLNFMGMALMAAVIPIWMYRRHCRDSDEPMPYSVALRIGPGAVFLGSVIALLHITPEMVSLMNAGSVWVDSDGQSRTTLLSPLPFIPIDGIPKVPLLIYVGIQKVVLLPLVSMIAVTLYRGLGTPHERGEPNRRKGIPTRVAPNRAIA